MIQVLGQDVIKQSLFHAACSALILPLLIRGLLIMGAAALNRRFKAAVTHHEHQRVVISQNPHERIILTY